ncbi:hypothetical protein D9757_013702 [Collybiopsis confluens]|uniref:Uncharacterized protein n=1 Tax=Collybiopsis confluens TaxID=2823264 RepID=A0A8H5GMX4_9AGAR|nr:hypothetical protein D9757_013702 [Collybiopsis confluens]
MLYGFLCSQVWSYYETFPKDLTRIKVLVFYLMAVVTAQTAMNAHEVLITFGTHFSEVDALQKINLQWFACPIITVLAGFPVQMFYAYRMTRFSRSNCASKITKVIVVIVVVLALFASITSIIGGVKVYQGQFEQSIFNEAVKFQEMWLVSSASLHVKADV